MEAVLAKKGFETIEPLPGQTQPPPRPLLSPLNRRRLENFKANRRGYWSLWIFLVLFILSLFAEFIANDRPLVLSFKGHLYFPVLRDYQESDFLPPDEAFQAIVEYRSDFIQEAIRADGWMVWPPLQKWVGGLPFFAKAFR